MKIASLLQTGGPFYSLEFFPPADKAQWPDFLGVVDSLRGLSPAFVSITYGAGGNSSEKTLDLTRALADKGLVTMPHLTCLGSSPEGVRDFLDKLAGSGVENVLALRGDPPKGRPLFPEQRHFSHAADLVRFIRTEFPPFGIGVAAYLTPHPESASFAEDRQATKAKLDAGGDFAISQLFFDHREYFEYVAQMRALGMTKPILPGVLPIQSLDALRRILSLSGCNIPAKLYLALEETQRTGGPAAVREAGIRHAVNQIRCLLKGGAPGIHLYTLNKTAVCLRIAEAVGSLR
ncbi:MAG: methylenetetrahydrofolate reductase [Desulfovibrio sp.]|jgi:methylenetetrahydrofolate reductase (NADPH)|nr:methylenetetrahydrofolate reductase [Desulfovibrio sp.]